jgi:DNA-binding NarL/FixJ family response regulator
VAEKITIALIESSYLLRSGIDQLLRELPGAQLVEVYDGTEKKLLKKIESLKPDCIIINPEAISGSLNSFIACLNKEITIVGLMSDQTATQIQSRFKYHLYMEKGKHELLNSISQIVGRENGRKPVHSNDLLTEREITILKFVTLGLTNQEIAEKLFLSIHTVMTHRKNITKKLGIKTVSGLTVYAILNKIIEIQDVGQ